MTPDQGGEPPSLDIHEGRATIQLRRPSRLNRLQPGDLRIIQAHCERVAANEAIRVVVLTADTTGQRQPVFSAGYDIAGFEGQEHDPRLFEDTVEVIARLPQVVIAAVTGSVYGGATDLVLACDLRLGLAGSQWRMPACALGLHYYPSGLRRYVRLLGLDGARQAFLTASPIAFERLEALGTFMGLHAASALETAVDTLARQVASLSPQALRSTKASLNEIAEARAETRVLREREADSLASADFAEGRLAFAQRRPPQFTGSSS